MALSPPGNDTPQLSAPASLGLALASASREPSLQFPGLWVFCTATQHSLSPLLLGLLPALGGCGEAARLRGFVFCLAVAAARPHLPHLGAPSLPRSLCSAPLHANPAGSSTRGCRERMLQPDPSPPSPPVQGTHLCASSLPPPLFTLLHPPPGVSPHGPLRRVCVLCRGSPG